MQPTKLSAEQKKEASDCGDSVRDDVKAIVDAGKFSDGVAAMVTLCAARITLEAIDRIDSGAVLLKILSSGEEEMSRAYVVILRAAAKTLDTMADGLQVSFPTGSAEGKQ